MTAAVTTPHQVASLSAPECRCARVSPDGTSVLTVGGGRMQMWDTASGRPGWSRSWDAPAEFPVEAVWSAGGDTLTLLSGGRLDLVDAVLGTDLPVPVEVTGRLDVTALVLSPDGLTLAIGTNEGVVLLWRQDVGRVNRLRGGGDPVTALAWGPTGTELCVARPRSIQFWHMADQTMISSIDMADVGPLRLACAPDGGLIVALGLGDVRVLSMATRSESAAPLRTGGRPVGVGFSRTGAILLVGRPDGTVQLLDRQLQRAAVNPSQLATGLVEPAALHVNETGLVAARTDAATVGLFTLPDTLSAPEERRRTVAVRRWAAGLVRSPRGSDDALTLPVPTTLARGSGFAWAEDGWYLQDRGRGELTRYAGDGSRQWTVPAGTGVLSVDQRHVAVDGGTGLIAVLDAGTGAPVATIAGVGRASWAPRAVAVAAPHRRDVLVYDQDWSYRTVPTPDGTGDPAWSPDGHALLAASPTAVVMWDGHTLQRNRRSDLGTGTRPAGVVWAPDGNRFALNRPGVPVTVWSVAQWRSDQQLATSASDRARALAWSPESHLLAIPSRRTIGAVDLWDVRAGRIRLTVPPSPEGARPVSTVDWAADGRFAVGHDDGTVVRWQLTVPPPQGDATGSAHPAPVLAALVAATASSGTMVSPWLLGDLLSLVQGGDAGPLAEFNGHPGIGLLRGLRWPADAAVGLAVLVAASLPPEPELVPPSDLDGDELRAAVMHALDGSVRPADAYRPPAGALLRELDRIDDSVVILATLLGPDAVAAAPDLLARARSQSFGGWSLAPQQRRLLGLRAATSSAGDSQGRGVGDTRAGIARHGEPPSLLPTQFALPRALLAVKKSRDELLFRTRRGDLSVAAQPVVLLLDDTPGAFGGVGVTLRIVGNLLAAIAIRRSHRCALVPLSSGRITFLTAMADLVHLWSAGTVDGPDLTRALTAAGNAAAQLSDAVNGLPRLVLLTHPHLPCPSRPGLHIVRVHYPGLAAEDPAPRTHMLSPGASADQIHEVIGEILSNR